MTIATAVPDVPFSRHRHEGTGYLRLLRRLHALRRPRHYLEIGTAAGKTLALARCASIAIDPRFRLAHDAVLERTAVMKGAVKLHDWIGGADHHQP